MQMWNFRGQHRPDFAIEPEPGQESVWDYPRPPAVVADERSIEVGDADALVATTTRSVRVLETSHPPAFYVPPEAVIPGRLVPTAGAVAEALYRADGVRRTRLPLLKHAPIERG